MSDSSGKIEKFKKDIKKGMILFAADFQSEFQRGILDALQSLGWKVERFYWKEGISRFFWDRIQDKYLFGPVVEKINENLIERCKTLRPDVVFIYKGVYVWPQTIIQIKRYARLVVSYHPDNPFGQYNADYAQRYRSTKNALLSRIMVYEKIFYFKRLMVNFIKTISSYDINFVPRESNVREYQVAGAREVYLLSWFYIPRLHRFIELMEEEKKKIESDVVFIGHFDSDQRIECLEALIDAGIHVRVFGTGWDPYLTKKLKRAFGPSIKPLYGDEYVKALCASKMALCFMSKLNKDTSTIRCFEIPACGILLLSERTNELKDELYEEDKEAVYFSDKVELVEKVKMLLDKPEKREAIANAGHERCLSSGRDVVSRMRIWDDVVCKRLNIA
jgi:glycosyltransferase involved in cell wall biosynthesis